MDDVEFARRRRWSLEEKRAIVELSLDPESSVTEVAGCFDLLPAQIYGWRRELREQAEDEARDEMPMFLPAVIAPIALPVSPDTEPESSPMLPDAMVQVALNVRGVPVRIAHGASAALVASVIAALQRAR